MLKDQSKRVLELRSGHQRPTQSSEGEVQERATLGYPEGVCPWDRGQ